MRLVGITYDGLTIGRGQTGTVFHLTDKFSLSLSPEEARLEFEVVLADAVRANVLAAEASLRTAYKEPDARLTINMGDTIRYDFNPADRSGFLSQPSLELLPTEDQTSNSARYRCTVVVQLPADYANLAGRRSASINVSTTPAGRRTVTVSGVYTALSNNSARDQFAAQITAFASEALNSVDSDATWELVGTPVAEEDDFYRLLTFRRTFREVLVDQALGQRSHPDLTEQTLAIRRAEASREATQALGSAAPMVELVVEYQVHVRKGAGDLRRTYQSVCRPHILAQLSQQASRFVVTAESVQTFEDERIIQASLSVSADPGTEFIWAAVSWSESASYGKILHPLWDGDPLSRDREQGPAAAQRMLLRTTVGYGAPMSLLYPVRLAALHGPPPEMSGWDLVAESRRARDRAIGVDGGQTLVVVTSMARYERARVRGDDEDDVGELREAISLGIEP